MSFDFQQAPISCGVTECWHLEDNVDAFILKYAKQLSRVGKHYRTVMFSDSISRGIGAKLAAKLEAYGDIVKSKKVNNPIHQHPIQVYIWHPSEHFITKQMPKIVERLSKPSPAVGSPWR